MCVPALLAPLGLGGATAAGATAAATTGGFLQIAGTLLSVGGAVAQGIAGNRAAKASVRAIEDQKATEARLTAVRDQRTRMMFNSQIRKQTAELAARGIRLDSPTALLLGQTAARELSFESQAIRSGGAARTAELTNEQRILRAQGQSSLLQGVVNASGSFLKAAPDLWPELLA